MLQTQYKNYIFVNMNLQDVNNLIVNRKPFTYSIKFGDVSGLDGSVYKVYSWFPVPKGVTLKDVMEYYSDMFTEQTAVIQAEKSDKYYMISVAHMNMLNSIEIKSYDESKRT